MQEDKIIREISRELKNKYSDFYGIYFFGSRSRGEGNEDSDIDIAVLFDRTIDWKFEREIFDLVCDYNVKYDTIIDTKVFAKNEILKPITRFRNIVKTEGILYV